MKRKQFQFVGVIALLSILLSSCMFIGPSVKGNGKVKEEVRQVGEFDQVKVSRGMNVYILQGSPARVVVIADSNLHELIETKVEGGVLKITTKENIRWAEEKKVMVTVEKLTGVGANSGGNVWSQSQIKLADLKLEANSGANLTMDIDAGTLSADCSSGANIKLSGLAKEADLGTSSGANLKGEKLIVNECKMSASSGGNVSSTVTGKLDAQASSGGNIAYYGEPTSTNVNSSSGGSIHRKQ
ncbi:MAG: DUF2807 domain-containing protein [Mariniphaga sp.]|nr:DUF2807 domain-containing protein [Mariniphaga sp.]